MSPNLITLLGIAMTIAGAAIAAGAGWRVHAIGAALLFAAAVLDGVDGEVARLRLETSRLGGWLDTVGDDISRLAVIVGIGLHVATRHPALHVGWLIVTTLVLTVVANALLYAWCLARGTADNQGYGPAMGTSRLARFAAFVARRDFSDLFVVGLALADRSEVTLGALAVGSAVTLVVVAVRGTR
jgi:phosphatidylglycerophosphate synthase